MISQFYQQRSNKFNGPRKKKCNNYISYIHIVLIIQHDYVERAKLLFSLAVPIKLNLMLKLLQTFMRKYTQKQRRKSNEALCQLLCFFQATVFCGIMFLLLGNEFSIKYKFYKYWPFSLVFLVPLYPIVFQYYVFYDIEKLLIFL